MTTKEHEEAFWDAMERSAAPAKSAPSWKLAGINLSERNYTTFRSTSSADARELTANESEDNS